MPRVLEQHVARIAQKMVSALALAPHMAAGPLSTIPCRVIPIGVKASYYSRG